MGKHLNRLFRAAYLTGEITAAVRDRLCVLVQRQRFLLLKLPSDLVLLIASHLHDTCPLSKLARTSRALHGLLMPLLYQYATQETRPDAPTRFQWLPTPGRTVLHFAAAHGEMKLLTNVIQRAGRKLLDAKDHYGMTPLVSAVLWGHAEAVGILLEAGADVEARCAPHGWTALQVAASLKDPEMLRLLSGAVIDDHEDAREVLDIQQIIDMFSYEMDKCRWCTVGVQAKVSPDSRRFLRTALERSQIKRPESKWPWRISGCSEVGMVLEETEVLVDKRKRGEF